MATTRRCIDDLADKLADYAETLRDPVTDTEFEVRAFVTTEVNGVLEVRKRRYPEGRPVTVVEDAGEIIVRHADVTKFPSVDLALERVHLILGSEQSCFGNRKGKS